MSKKRIATIYDYYHFLKANDKAPNMLSWDLSLNDLIYLNDTIIDWCDEQPVRTRQSEFLKMFPNEEFPNE